MAPPLRQQDGSALLRDAVRIARRAGALLKSRFGTGIEVHFKGEVDLVTEMDRAAQSLVVDEIRRLYPGAGILAEEGLDEPGETHLLFIVDPLDGTTNYAHSFPVFAVSIGVLSDGVPECGVVFSPVSRECYTARRGKGAFLNGKPIRVSAVASLGRSLLGTGFPYDIKVTGDNNLDHFARFALRAQGVRRCGSAALDLCFVAAARFDGFWELNLKPWDIAAAALVVKEAGGAVTDFAGRAVTTDGSRVCASNGIIHDQMMEILAGCREAR